MSNKSRRTTTKQPGVIEVQLDNWRFEIPPECRDGITDNAQMVIIPTGSGMKLIPREEAALAALRELGERMRAKGLTSEGLIESGREIRSDLLREMYGIEADE